MNDHGAYDTLRTKCDATYLPTTYAKVKVDVDAEERAIKESWIVWLLVCFGVYGRSADGMGCLKLQLVAIIFYRRVKMGP